MFTFNTSLWKLVLWIFFSLLCDSFKLKEYKVKDMSELIYKVYSTFIKDNPFFNQ